MSIFSKVKNAKKAAEQHKTAIQAEKDKPKPVPYRHVPTHAAQDALSSAPTSWSVEESRARVAEYNKRKSAIGRPPNDIASFRSLSRTASEMSLQSIQNRPRSLSNRSSPFVFYGTVPPVPSIPSQYSSTHSNEVPLSPSGLSTHVKNRIPNGTLYESSTEEEEETESSSTHSRSSGSSNSSYSQISLDIKTSQINSPAQMPAPLQFHTKTSPLSRTKSEERPAPLELPPLMQTMEQPAPKKKRSLFGGMSRPSFSALKA